MGYGVAEVHQLTFTKVFLRPVNALSTLSMTFSTNPFNLLEFLMGLLQ